jgi:hypothetical protein
MTILFLFQIAMLASSMSIHLGKPKITLRQRDLELTCAARSMTELCNGIGSQWSAGKGERKVRSAVIKDRSTSEGLLTNVKLRMSLESQHIRFVYDKVM